MLQEQSFDTGVISINYAEGPPSGPPLVLLHGISGWWQTWLTVMPVLSMRWHLYALDFRGHGKSDWVPRGYHWGAYVDDTISFLRERVIQPTILVGHSMGAIVTLMIAAKAPDVVRAIVLEDPPLYLRRDDGLRGGEFRDKFRRLQSVAQTPYSLEAWLPLLAEISPDDHELDLHHRARTLSLLDPDVFGQAVDGSAIEQCDIEADTQRLTCPTLLLQGNPALGGVVEDEDIEWFKSLLPGSVVVSMPEVGHGIHSQQPVGFSSAVTTFLEIL
jgi:pimeloyl-ACP methyl ester carboxylesterase